MSVGDATPSEDDDEIEVIDNSPKGRDLKRRKIVPEVPVMSQERPRPRRLVAKRTDMESQGGNSSMQEDVSDGASRVLDIANLGGTVQVLNAMQCQSLAAILEGAHNRLSQDIEACLVELEVAQSRLQSTEHAQKETKLKLDAVVRHLGEFEDGK